MVSLFNGTLIGQTIEQRIGDSDILLTHYKARMNSCWCLIGWVAASSYSELDTKFDNLYVINMGQLASLGFSRYFAGNM